jgi:two-component sensor histidine kinase
MAPLTSLHPPGGAGFASSSDAMSDDTLRMLELSHRTKNILSIVQALVNQSLRADRPMEEARSVLSNRLVAMGSAVDTLLRTEWQPATLQAIVQAGLVHGASFEGRVRVSGPTVEIGAGAAMSLSLVLHELESNAMKYGALSTPTGAVDIRWTVIGSGDGATLMMFWEERGGPPVSLPDRRGFGTRLIGSGISRRLGGTSDCRFEREGFGWTLSAPMRELIV